LDCYNEAAAHCGLCGERGSLGHGGENTIRLLSAFSESKYGSSVVMLWGLGSRTGEDKAMERVKKKIKAKKLTGMGGQARGVQEEEPGRYATRSNGRGTASEDILASIRPQVGRT